MDSMVLLWVLFMAAIIVGAVVLNIRLNKNDVIIPCINDDDDGWPLYYM